MSGPLRVLAATALVGASFLSFSASSAAAMPVGQGLAIDHAAPATVEQVRWGGRGFGGFRGFRGFHRGFGPGFFAGALVGSALVAPYYYGYGPYEYDDGPYYAYPPGPAYYRAPPGYQVVPGPQGGDAVAYCMQRFRSYDPRTGTYLGLDGLRHPCP